MMAESNQASRANLGAPGTGEYPHPRSNTGPLSAHPLLSTSYASLPPDFADSLDDATIIACGDGQHTPRQKKTRLHKHAHGPLDPEKALRTGGLSFAPVYSEIDNAERQRRSKLKWAFPLLSVGLQALTGVITGTAAFAVGMTSEALGEMRLNLTLQLLQQHHWALAWASLFGFMLLLALAGALPVIFLVPSAGSSGIPAIIGILNGCDLTQDFTWKILCVRFIGVTCAVASGLAVGPEGPMIFIGACTGALLSRIPSQRRVWNFFGRPPASLNYHVYLRDYISTGAACGIAAAFRAPIAGTLFVVEEAASHFRREHLAKILLGGLLAMILATNLAGEQGILEYQVTTGENCRTREWLYMRDYVFFVIVGVVCGVAGAVFNKINASVCIWRAQHIKPAMSSRRCGEILFLCFITSGFWILLPFCVLEMPTGNPRIFSRGNACIKDGLKPQIIAGAHIEGSVGLNLKYTPEPCLYGVQQNDQLCRQAWNYSDNNPHNPHAWACTQGLNLKIDSTIYPDLDERSFCCNFTGLQSLTQLSQFQLPSNASCVIDLGKSFPSLNDNRSENRSLFPWKEQTREVVPQASNKQLHYNPMAALTLVPFNKAAQNLFSRGAPYLLPWWVLCLFLPVFFLLAAITAGSAIPSGLLLPTICIGGLIGRLLALVFIEFQVAFSIYQAQSASDSIWAAVFQPLFSHNGGPIPEDAPLATSGWLDPGVGAIIGAAAFLGGTSRISLTITVMMVEITGDPMMIAPVGVATLVAVIVGNRFNAGLYHSLMDVASFPFLPDRWPKSIPKALRIEHILNSPEEVVCINLQAQRTDLERILQGYSYTGFPVLDNGVVVGFATRDHLQTLLDLLEDTVDVGRVTDFHCVTIRVSLPLEMAYDLFKRMEISHMIVVDNSHYPVAMLTRGSLLPWLVEEHIANKQMHVRSTIRRPRSFRPEGQTVEDTFFVSDADSVIVASHGRVDGLGGSERLDATMKSDFAKSTSEPCMQSIQE